MDGDDPFFLIFDEFHVENFKNAPNEYKKWKIFSIACANLRGDLQIVYLKTTTTGVQVLGSEFIKECVEFVHSFIKKMPKLHHKMAGAGADKCSANLKAIKYLQMQGIPVLYDLRHFQDTLQRGRYIDQIFCRLYVDPTISGDNMEKILKLSGSIVGEDVPIELKGRYEDEVFLKLI
ncbi:uncharacterized protein LOC123257324 [Drosophila ananassae]|uniref:uncharacterized protein LOC123257324 n=1 Tax=Drosophila ananassae TaxID=7217 RepID=UPI001D0000AA|nr:uncharacterized protein LOC123257324 [Drosophila ananassae]